jgi:nucleoside-diphosphate-sugar epimerase
VDATILRPGFIWGPGNDYVAGAGLGLGPVEVVFGRRTLLPLTYVENCADCFAHAVERPAAIGQTLNVIDDEDVSAWRFMREYVRHVPGGGRAVPMPYAAARTAGQLAQFVSRTAFGEGGRLPSILTPAHFEARFKPLRFSVERVRSVLGWQPPWTLEAAMDRTYGRPGSAPSPLA